MIHHQNHFTGYPSDMLVDGLVGGLYLYVWVIHVDQLGVLAGEPKTLSMSIYTRDIIHLVVFNVIVRYFI